MVRVHFPRRPPKKERGPARLAWGIKRSVLGLIMESSRASYPDEFSAVLAQTREGLIDDLLLIPGTVQGDAHAIMQFYQIPSGFRLAGSVHSHPSGVCEPSDADLNFFSRLGDTHIIAGRPYSMTSWRAYDAEGGPLHLDVVDDDGDGAAADPPGPST